MTHCKTHQGLKSYSFLCNSSKAAKQGKMKSCEIVVYVVVLSVWMCMCVYVLWCMCVDTSGYVNIALYFFHVLNSCTTYCCLFDFVSYVTKKNPIKIVIKKKQQKKLSQDNT